MTRAAELSSLQAGPPLPHRIALEVLGLPVVVSSNEPEVLERAAEAFGGAARAAPVGAPRPLDRRDEGQGDDRAVEVRIAVRRGEEEDDGDGGPPEVGHRMVPPYGVLFTTRGSVAFADPARRRSDAVVTPAWLAHRRHFRHALLEAVTLAVLTRMDRQPLHASAVAHPHEGGAALLLCAPGGTGKSTLAYASLRAGLRVLSEDTVYVQMRPRLRVWGMPGPLHLPPERRSDFPELADLEPTRLATGKTKLRVCPAQGVVAPPGEGWPSAERAGVCLLRRSGERPGVSRVSAAELTAALTGPLEPGFDLFRETLPDAVRRLAVHGGWRVDLPPDSGEAVPWLIDLLAEVEARGG